MPGRPESPAVNLMLCSSRLRQQREAGDPPGRLDSWTSQTAELWQRAIEEDPSPVGPFVHLRGGEEQGHTGGTTGHPSMVLRHSAECQSFPFRSAWLLPCGIIKRVLCHTCPQLRERSKSKDQNWVSVKCTLLLKEFKLLC